MKKVLFIILLINVISCNKLKTESYKVNKEEYVIKTDSVNIQVINKDTLKFYYLKNKLRSVTINNFLTPEYDTVQDHPFYFQTIYCINENNEFNAVITELNSVKVIADFSQNSEYELSGEKWKSRGNVENYFYNSEVINLDIALTRIGDYNFPKTVINILDNSAVDLIIIQDKGIDLYSSDNLKKIKNKIYDKFPFIYLRDIKVVKEGSKNTILAKILDRDRDVEYYINLKDIEGNVVPAD
ncbi:hypothetical protein [Flavobacterium anhuiense]|uniref:hypothetical protein n=1 Tax=Flavobacterium anhuiense TaxID=459526 RepID=UPI000E6D5819|nr:hypothetical protein [Flavobacterium anhuiense]